MVSQFNERSENLMAEDDRYVRGMHVPMGPIGAFGYLFKSDYSKFYNLKERAKKELTSSQLKHLFNPTIAMAPNARWWDLESPNYTYPLDHYGFRSSPILSKMEDVTVNQWKNSYVCLGCSWTFGIGVPEYFTWPEILSMENDWDCLNFGVPSAGIETSYRLLNTWIEHFGIAPKNVLISGWFTPRLERYNRVQRQYESINLQTHGNTKELVNEVKTNAIFKFYLRKFKELKEKWNLNIYRVNPSVISMHDMTVSTLADTEYFKNKEEFLSLKGYGYDLSHPSPHANRKIANVLKHLIEIEDKFII